MTTGAVFALLVVAHIWRMIEEGPHLLKDPWYVLITIAAATLPVGVPRAQPRARSQAIAASDTMGAQS